MGKIEHLRHDFADSEVAEEAHLPGGAKDAAHGAARLRADAERTPLVVAHEHRLDVLAIWQLEEHFFGTAVAGTLLAGDGGTVNNRVGFQLLNQVPRQITHLGKFGDVLLVQPFPNLLRPKLRLAQFVQEAD